MLSVEGTGKNIEKAIENALLELKAPREDVDIKILEEGGLFRKAKVLVSISDDCKEKYEKKTVKVQEKKANVEEDKIDIKAMFADLGKEEKKKEKEDNKKSKKEDKEEKDDDDDKKLEKREERLSGKEFIEGILKELKIEANLSVDESDESIKISIEGGNSGDLIGYRGECLNAIQYLASIIENGGTDSRRRLVLDIENYRGRREESLKGLAHRMESKVAKTNRSVKLEPMNANERRIIHTELQSSDQVETTSKGAEPNRFVVIFPKRDGKSTEDDVKNEENSSTEE